MKKNEWSISPDYIMTKKMNTKKSKFRMFLESENVKSALQLTIFFALTVFFAVNFWNQILG